MTLIPSRVKLQLRAVSRFTSAYGPDWNLAPKCFILCVPQLTLHIWASPVNSAETHSAHLDCSMWLEGCAASKSANQRGQKRCSGGVNCFKPIVLLSSQNFQINGTKLTKVLLRSRVLSLISINDDTHDVCCAVWHTGVQAQSCQQAHLREERFIFQSRSQAPWHFIKSFHRNVSDTIEEHIFGRHSCCKSSENFVFTCS